MQARLHLHSISAPQPNYTGPRRTQLGAWPNTHPRGGTRGGYLNTMGEHTQPADTEHVIVRRSAGLQRPAAPAPCHTRCKGDSPRKSCSKSPFYPRMRAPLDQSCCPAAAAARQAESHHFGIRFKAKNIQARAHTAQAKRAVNMGACTK